MKKTKLIQIIIGIVLLYAISAGVSYMILNSFLKAPVSISTPFGSLTDITSGNEEGTRDQPCPVNGALYTKTRQDQWQKRRPLGIMVENHVDARPTLGLARADAIYEAVAEGGITRFLAIYLCQDAGDIAPIRSARTYFLDWVSEYDAAYAHVGGANTAGPADALGQIRNYNIKDMDQFGLGFPTYWRGTDKLAPHNVHSTTKKLWDAAASRGFGPQDEKGIRWDKNFIQWKFKDDQKLENRLPPTKPIIVPFWPQSPDYTVTWKYDRDTNLYRRFHGEVAQIDPIVNENLAAKNIVIQFETERQANDGYPDGHLIYQTTGSGTALILMDGQVIRGQWIKNGRTQRTKYVDAQGREIQFNRGLIWIETIPVGNNVQY